MSVQATTQVWKLECDPEYKLVLLWIAEACGGDGINDWWRYDFEQLTRMTALPAFTASQMLRTLQDEGILVYDEWKNGQGSVRDTHYLLDLRPWQNDAPDVVTAPSPAERRQRYTKKKIPHGLRRRVFERDQYRCRHCSEWHDLCADHVVPEANGGPTELDNLQTLCRSCNSRKGTS